jgi:multiple sugar transport system substrate-binding protein
MKKTQSAKAREKLNRIIEGVKQGGGNQLPPEADLLREIGVGRNTLRKVIGELVAQGVLQRIQGKGTFIAKQYRRMRFVNWASSELSPSLFLDKLIHEFHTSHTEMEIENITIPYHQYLENMIQMLIHGEELDVVQLTTFWLRYLQRFNLLVPLDNYISQELINRRYPNAFSLGKVNNSIYSINWALCPLVLYCNKVVLSKAGLDPERLPRTLDELSDMSKHVGNCDGSLHGLALPFALFELSFDCLYLFLLSFGGGFANSIGNVTIDCQANVEALRWLRQLFEDGGIKKEQNLNGARVLFVSDHLAFMIDGPQGRGYLRKLSGRGKDFDRSYTVVEMPVGPTNRSESVLLAPALAIAASCRRPERAYEWIEFLVNNEDNARLYFERYGLIPCNRDMLHKPFFFSDSFASVLIRQLESASRSPVDHPLFLRAVPFMLQTFSRIIFEGLDAAEGLEYLRQVINMIGNSNMLPYS